MTNPPPSSYRRTTSVAPVLCSMAPTALGAGIDGLALGGLDAPPPPEADGALPAAEPLHAARTTTRAAKAAERDSNNMAPGRPTRADGSTGRVRLQNGSKGLDGTRIFTAMSSGL